MRTCVTSDSPLRRTEGVGRTSYVPPMVFGVAGSLCLPWTSRRVASSVLVVAHPRNVCSAQRLCLFAYFCLAYLARVSRWLSRPWGRSHCRMGLPMATAAYFWGIQRSNHFFSTLRNIISLPSNHKHLERSAPRAVFTFALTLTTPHTSRPMLAHVPSESYDHHVH